jgi:hypothetical protein
MLVVDILDVDPLNLEVAFKLQSVVFPPKGESLLMVP